jgi:hypothetical protein
MVLPRDLESPPFGLESSPFVEEPPRYRSKVAARTSRTIRRVQGARIDARRSREALGHDAAPVAVVSQSKEIRKRKEDDVRDREDRGPDLG